MATHKMSHSFILSCSCLLQRFEHTYVQQHAGGVHVGLLPVERTVVVVVLVLVLVLVVAAVLLVAVIVVAQDEDA